MSSLMYNTKQEAQNSLLENIEAFLNQEDSESLVKTISVDEVMNTIQKTKKESSQK
ncbi:hypothetical protein BB559_005091 [Furculomyces boomerangus]|uniref:Uncharacterized protein n=2 Tax=Harpellales TaxID=61421 RepID=A0A2T9YAU6_9FUNG|nr:hypothetical protein BB559_005091 [Furculomyces boomerangus]PWA01908.1 hypothetical protein BB558_001965 [Smittium angustum]